MPAATPRPAHYRWSDADGAHIALFSWVEQVAESAELAALPSRLHQHGQVLGRSLDSLYVCFPGNEMVSLPPRLLRLLPDAPDQC
jgi:hypothetical protein